MFLSHLGTAILVSGSFILGNCIPTFPFTFYTCIEEHISVTLSVNVSASIHYIHSIPWKLSITSQQKLD